MTAGDGRARKALAMAAVILVLAPPMALADSVQHHADRTDTHVVQQHTVFVEMFRVTEGITEERHPFGVVVGLVKECRVRTYPGDAFLRAFDNAVLWFNDQFLFGEKHKNFTKINDTRTISPLGPTIGDNRNNMSKFKRADGDTGRYSECEVEDGIVEAAFIPDRWVWAQPTSAPDTLGSVFNIGGSASGAYENAYDGATGAGCATPPTCGPTSVADGLVRMLELDRLCNGCVFQYISSFQVTDPNGVNWVIDKYAYPVCFVEDRVGPTAATPNPCGGRHADIADDRNGTGGDQDQRNHCEAADPSDPSQGCRIDDPSSGPYRHNESPGPIQHYEPIWVTHIQVDPVDRMGFRDEAAWAWTGASGGGFRQGAPRYDAGDDGSASDRSPQVRDGSGDCAGGNSDPACSIEYNFLLAIDFVMVGGPLNEPGLAPSGWQEYEPECKEHGPGGADENDSYLFGNSHGQNPNEPANHTGPMHQHDCVYVDIISTANGNQFTEDHPLWDADYRAPLPLNETCTGVSPHLVYDDHATADTSDDEYTDGLRRWPAAWAANIDARTFEVCDIDDDAGEYHLHDGSQTPFERVPPQKSIRDEVPP